MAAAAPADIPVRGGPPAQSDGDRLPSFVTERNALFEELKKKHDDAVAAKPRNPITVSLTVGPDSVTEVSATAWETTPGQLLKHAPKTIASEAIVAKVNGEVWDLTRPLEADSSVSYLSSADPEGRAVFWHSAAHVLGEACEHHYGCRLSHGPPTNMGFFYDMAMQEGDAVKETDRPVLESLAKKFFKAKQPFERVEIGKEDLRKLFGYSKYKMHYIEKFVPDGGSTTVYRNGSLVDLCTGPHIQNTKQISAFKIMGNSSAYFLGDQANDSLQRISGVAFAKNDQMKAWLTYLEEAKKRDHQLIGKNQKLFWFSPLSPGSPFFLPHGTRIFNAIQSMLREQYWMRGYDEVQSPLMYDVQLWKTSGHWQHYQEDMFSVPLKHTTAPDTAPASSPDASKDTDKPTDKKADETAKLEQERLFALKPMNCPGHALMFASEERSYRSLPWRVADFSALHRNEASGALSGLTRVRKFQQDDAHIFCTIDQVTDELRGMFKFMTHVYTLFGFSFKLKLSTRPDSYMGKLSDWDAAEERLKNALKEFRGDDWVLNPGDGAFYGPKIDVTVNDALGREFQCATIQLDFQLPQNFNLLYRTSESVADQAKTEGAEEGSIPSGMARPVMIHRAVVGSFERFLGIIIEHFAGKWPFWLSPRQVMVIPIMKEAEDYAREVRDILHDAKLYADVDVSGNTLQKKIRAAQLAQYNFVMVVGAEEIAQRAVNIRNRDDTSSQQKGAMIDLDDVVKRLVLLKEERRLVNSI
ncbi:threonyl-tRNA synthetase [Pochonia chlamydosporia 170]|uniref:threonine--tRNA ligase n=1 Tax=Pochonia chlamydosporia 170 TaxID=1380566 RepID=A0A179F5M5_METCM|nr:threonyl-tRNA synthetase [Pochonia chlamydosporia 170]OAQ60736.2 threonyl-tRNA synthetase [Pochonia chlamydosporia 170]